LIKLIRASISFNDWKKTSFHERSHYLLKIAELLLENLPSLATLITQEMGKPIKESRSEIEKCALVCQYYAKESEQLLQPLINEKKGNKIIYQPMGTLLGIMPWNFPFWQVFRFAIPALMAGNTVLLKHAPNVCGCAQTIETLFLKAGLPPHVFQTLIINTDLIEHIISNNNICGVTFTGSEAAGAIVASLAGKHIKKSVLELGGSDPFIVLENANLEQASKAAVTSRMLNAGQACIAAKRFIVAHTIKEEFIQQFKTHIQTLKQGNPLEETVQIGPLARIDLAQKLQTQLTLSRAEGAQLHCGGNTNGCNFEPTLISTDNPQINALQNETFGPLATVISVTNEQEAITLANNTTYGLGASIWTQDIDKGLQLAERIEAGNVFINNIVKSSPELPFGGIKRSGYGRELNEYGLKEFMNIKTIVY